MVKRILLPALMVVMIALLTSYKSADTRSKVLIHTSFGDIKIVLYDETPKHRDNFLKLVQNHTLDSTLFHRVIPQFMIQGGDVDSKHAKPGQFLGNGTLGYTIPAEFNPNKESSACQFYIVQGKTYTDSMLNLTQAGLDQQVKQALFTKMINAPENAGLKSAFIRAQMRYQQTRNADSLNYYSGIINPQIDAEFAKTPHRVITDDQRKVYETIGGTPQLDGGYTVFGEVVSGLNVVDSIANTKRDQYDRPLTDIRMTMKIVK
ncbi:MAG TPA: peptidylprolyl isomerase [Bacteroidia bacterium]|nr:peptidylprolyl isomerase [Bacteroidia bacterium]